MPQIALLGQVSYDIKQFRGIFEGQDYQGG